jgi:hypothetical protein
LLENGKQPIIWWSEIRSPLFETILYGYDLSVRFHYFDQYLSMKEHLYYFFPKGNMNC